MEYRGIYENGLIRPSEPIDFPNGTEVVFHEIHIGNQPGAVSRDATNGPSVDERLTPGFSIGQLAEEQEVEPFVSMDQLGGEWPESDDIDEFLRTIREWRR